MIQASRSLVKHILLTFAMDFLPDVMVLTPLWATLTKFAVTGHPAQIFQGPQQQGASLSCGYLKYFSNIGRQKKVVYKVDLSVT